MHIGLNAHLLSHQTGYRSAGIHSYIDHLLPHLAIHAPDDWRFTAMVGGKNSVRYDRVTMRRARIDTESPLKRILWEQLAQPFQLGDFDLYHGLAFIAPLWLSIPAVVTVYDLTFIHYPGRLSPARRLYLRLFTGVSCRRARRVIAISQSTARDLTARLNIPADRIDVTPLACDPAIFRPLPPEQIATFRRENDLPERFWLFLGTLEPRKNLTVLLEAYAALPQNERLPLILAGGKGWQYDDIFAAVEHHHLGGEVHFPGFIPATTLPFWYNSAEVFVYPSVFEGFGLPVLEAMACGTPVITSKVSSLPEVAGNSGLCLPPHDRAAWTEALHRAFHDTHWRVQARDKGLAEAKGFTWEKTAQLTVSSYRRALDG
ncbi:MAG TPA: glycosyltransferase family 1 protein [Anaerolineales bacterium]